MKGWKKILNTNGEEKKAGVTILKSDKMDFKIKVVKRDKEGHYIMIKGSIQEDITIINIYAPNIGALQCVRPMKGCLVDSIYRGLVFVSFSQSLSFGWGIQPIYI